MRLRVGRQNTGSRGTGGVSLSWTAVRTRAAVLTRTAVLLMGCAVSVQAADSALFNEGVDAFEKGKYEVARQKLEAYLLQSPSSSEVLDLLDKVGYQQFIQMSAENNVSLKKIATEVLQLSSIETRKRKQDSKAIGEALNKYFGEDDFLRQQRSLALALGNHGIYLVPGLVERLAVADNNVRVRAIVALAKIDDSVIPLCRVLRHSDPAVQQGAISALAKIKEPAAAASLQMLAETASDAGVRASAASVARELGASSGAYESLVDLASRFYNDSSYLSRTYHDPIIWDLKDGALTFRAVDAYEVNELRAKQFLADAIDMNAEGDAARRLNVCNELAQFAEFQILRAALEKKSSQGEGDEETLAKIQAKDRHMAQVRNSYPLSQDMETLLGALSLAMGDGRSEVAIEAIRSIKESWTNGDRAQAVPAALEAALGYDHRGVRFNAAECISYMNPHNGASEAVVTTLNETLVEAGSRVALLILNNEDDSLHMGRTLRDANNTVAFSESSALLGLDRAKGFPAEDVIILGTDVKGMSTATIIRNLRDDHRTKHIPILVLAEAGQVDEIEAVYKDESLNVGVIQRTISPDRLAGDILEPLYAATKDGRSEGTEISARAARALAFIATRTTNFDLSASAAPLIKVLANRPDSVRIPALEAIGTLALTDANEAMVRICRNESNDIAVVEAALKALGSANRSGAGVDPTVVEVLKNKTAHENVQVMKAASRALGTISKASMKK